MLNCPQYHIILYIYEINCIILSHTYKVILYSIYTLVPIALLYAVGRSGCDGDGDGEGVLITS